MKQSGASDGRSASELIEGEEVDAAAFTALIRQTVALNSAGAARRPARGTRGKTASASAKGAAGKGE